MSTDRPEFREWLNIYYGASWKWALDLARLFNNGDSPQKMFGPLV